MKTYHNRTFENYPNIHLFGNIYLIRHYTYAVKSLRFGRLRNDTSPKGARENE